MEQKGDKMLFPIIKQSSEGKPHPNAIPMEADGKLMWGMYFDVLTQLAAFVTEQGNIELSPYIVKGHVCIILP
jgi:hypothetical protein